MNPKQESEKFKQSGLGSSFSHWLESRSDLKANEQEGDLGDKTVAELMDVFACLEIVERVWPGECDSEFPDDGHGVAGPVQVPETIGPYRLIKKIAEGGMGAVFEAQQLQPIKRRVALKLIKAGRQSKQVIARFEAERQVLALMDHPNIAKIFDAGTTDRDEPYFVMELVNGVPLVEYCDSNCLSIPDRLRLFIEICRAVQHAHRKGIIHRDLKPSNVLVGIQDEAGEEIKPNKMDSRSDFPIPKIIDFGLAKAVQHHENLTEKPAQTQFGQVIGTLQYMSPEQAAANHGDVDTQTDVYSLGVMLHELLTGITPLNPKAMSDRPLHEILEVICNKEPVRPSFHFRSSHRLAQNAQSPESTIDIETVASQRKSQPSKLRQALHGELDWIVMKSLELEPQRRYQSANEMAEDIQRYLDGGAVTAGPQSRRYQLKKMVMRNRGLAAALATILFLLVAGLVGSFWGLNEAWKSEAVAIESGRKERQAKEQALGERTKAEKAATKYKDVLSVFKQSFAYANPMNGTSANISAADVINTAYESMESQTLDPVAKAELLTVISDCFFGLGKAEESLAAAQKAFDIHQNNKTRVDYAEQATVIGAYVRALLESGNSNRAHELLVDFLNENNDLQNDKQFLPNTLELKRLLAESLTKTGGYEEALKLAQEVRTARLETVGPVHFESFVAGNTLSIVLSKIGREEESYGLLKEMLASLETEDDLNAGTLVMLTNLGVNFQKQAKHREALPLLERVVAGFEKLLGAGHPRTLAAKGILGRSLVAVDLEQEGLEIHREVFSKVCELYGDESEKILIPIDDLANSLIRSGKESEALPLLEKGLRLSRRFKGERHPNTLVSMNNLANLYRKIGKWEQAIQYLEIAVENFESEKGATHADTLVLMGNLANAYQSAGRIDESLDLRKKALAAQQETLPADHPDLLIQLNSLGYAFQWAGRHEEALEIHQRAQAGFQKTLGDQHGTTTISKFNLAMTHESLGNLKESIRLNWEAFERSKGHFGMKHPATYASMNSLGRVLAKSGQLKESRDLLGECIKNYELGGEPRPWRYFEALANLGSTQMLQQELELATETLEQAIKGLEENANAIPFERRKTIVDAAIKYRIELADQMDDKAAQTKWSKKLNDSNRNSVNK